jgi:arsenate reductase
MINKPMVLILCTGNSCRSQMAEGFLKLYHGDLYDVQSAGTEPKPEIHPLAVRVMDEIGIDISGQRPKPLISYLGVAPVRHLVIVCDKANGTCPRIWPGTYTRTYMPFSDPAAFVGSESQTLQEFRNIRDQIGKAMKTWVPQVERAGR